ncbi:hypothetical protein AZE42_10545, partial [Rhizopogon vesiculosus]
MKKSRSTKTRKWPLRSPSLLTRRRRSMTLRQKKRRRTRIKGGRYGG